MRKLIITILITMIILTGCSEAWEDDQSEHEPSLHLIIIPNGEGIQTVPMWY